jgi:hypothetical protein
MHRQFAADLINYRDYSIKTSRSPMTFHGPSDPWFRLELHWHDSKVEQSIETLSFEELDAWRDPLMK